VGHVRPLADSARLRIGLFTNNYRPLLNGLATSVETFARAFREAGHAVTVVAPRYDAEEDPHVLRVPGLSAPTHHAYVLPVAAWPGVAGAVSERALDIYHAQHPFLLGAAARRWARRADRPFVFTYHTHYERYAHYVPGPARLVARLALLASVRLANAADLVVAPTAAVSRILRARGVRSPILVVPTGVPLAARPGPAARQALRERLGFSGAAPLCLTVGRLAPEKNLDFLLRAFALLCRDCPEAGLAVVGDGDERLRLERLAEALAIRDRVRFVGAVPHPAVVDYCLAADLFLFPSTSETQGLAALEGLAAGLPVIAVRSEAAEELLTGEEAGRLTVEEPAAFRQAALDLWRDAEARQAMGQAARRTAGRFTPEASASVLLTAYARLLRGRHAAAYPVRVRPSREART